jgi:hypothetical protein
MTPLDEIHFVSRLSILVVFAEAHLTVDGVDGVKAGIWSEREG